MSSAFEFGFGVSLKRELTKSVSGNSYDLRSNKDCRHFAGESFRQIRSLGEIFILANIRSDSELLSACHTANELYGKLVGSEQLLVMPLGKALLPEKVYLARVSRDLDDDQFLVTRISRQIEWNFDSLSVDQLEFLKSVVNALENLFSRV